MNQTNKRGAYLAAGCVVLAACLWGCIGIFVRRLTALGFTSMQITAIRCLINSALVFLWLLATDRKGLKIDPRDFFWFAANGIGSVFIFNTAYQASITMTSMSTAVVLLYTSPAFVMIFSILFFKEKLTGLKALCILLCIAGSALVSGITDGFSGSALGIGLGLLSGVGYALYSIFSVIILKKYSSFTNILYTFLFAGICALLVSGPGRTLTLLASSGEHLLWALSSAFFTGFLAYTAYTWALTRILASRAAVIAALEPVVAILLGVVLYHETITPAGILGIFMVLTAILLQTKVT